MRITQLVVWSYRLMLDRSSLKFMSFLRGFCKGLDRGKLLV